MRSEAIHEVEVDDLLGGALIAIPNQGSNGGDRVGARAPSDSESIPTLDSKFRLKGEDPARSSTMSCETVPGVEVAGLLTDVTVTEASNIPMSRGPGVSSNASDFDSRLNNDRSERLRCMSVRVAGANSHVASASSTKQRTLASSVCPNEVVIRSHDSWLNSGISET